MSRPDPIQFGDKYILLDQIGSGGVAEVFRGKLTRDRGFEKLIVIKKLLADHNSDREMVKVFIREARLAALLQHENIAATYDFGEIDGEYFLAMEYLFGKNLHSVMARARDNRELLGVAEALIVASRICEGMEYAHNLKDLQNKPLNIVHRDLTPHNIFITWEGKVKILDFGVAKAELFDNKTREGVVKGKISYMSPERLSGEDVDKRADIFSIGILLYEMISGTRMYQGDTAELIRKCLTADFENLKSIRPELDEAVYRIVDKALAVEIDKRYQSCAQMQADIDDLLFQMQQRVHSGLLKDAIRALFADEYKTEQEKVAEVLRIDSGIPLKRETGRIVASRSETGDEASSQDKTAVLYHRPPVQLFKLYAAKLSTWVQAQYRQAEALAAERKVDKRFLIGGAALFLGLILVAFLSTGDREESPAPAAADKKEVAAEKPAESAAEIAEQIPAEEDGSQERETAEPAEPQIEQEPQPAASTPDLPKATAEATAPSAPARSVVSEPAKVVVLKKQEMKIKKSGLAKSQQFAAEATDTGSKPGYPRKGQFEAPSEQVEISDQTLSFEEEAEDLARRKQLIALHAKAEVALHEGRLTQPVQQSAFSYFSEILRLDPKDEAAVDGLRLICEKYGTLAEESLAEQQYIQAEEYVTSGLSVIADDRRLIDIKARIERERRNHIFELSEKARLCLDAGKLSTPADDSAYFYYNEIARLDPGNKQVQEGYKKIADRYATLADQAFRQFDYTSAEQYVRRGLQVVPNHYYLLSLKSDLARSDLERYGHSVKKRLNKFLSE